MANLRRNEHLPTFVSWVSQLTEESPELFLGSNDTSNDFAFA